MMRFAAKKIHMKRTGISLDADVPVLVLGIVCPSDTTCYFSEPQRRRRITSSAISSVDDSALLRRFISLRL